MSISVWNIGALENYKVTDFKFTCEKDEIRFVREKIKERTPKDEAVERGKSR